MNGVYINILNNWSIQYASIEFTQPLLDKGFGTPGPLFFN